MLFRQFLKLSLIRIHPININKRFILLEVTSVSYYYIQETMKMRKSKNVQKQNLSSQKISLSEKLIDAAAKHNLKQVRDLIKSGAEVNYVRYTDSNCWYRGNSHTALYSAVHSGFQGDEKKYVDVVVELLENGADPNFQATRGGWNHSTQYPLFSGVARTLNQFKSQDEKIRFVEAFVKHGININQGENHGRSKNWSSYRNHSCFLFQVIDGCGISSKIGKLKKQFQVTDINQLQRQKEIQLRFIFDKQNPIQEEEEANTHQPKPQGQQEDTETKTVPQISFIKALVNFGANPNSSAGGSSWSNHSYDCFGDQDYQDYKYDEYRDSRFETVLHRAIMNDLPQLVKFLIEKGASTSQKCKFTITCPSYPDEWSEKYKQRVVKQNAKNLKEYEESKSKKEEELAKCVNEEEKKRLKKSIRSYEFSIFKAKRFAIENECPRSLYKDVEMSCLEIAEALKASPQILEMLKNSPVDKKEQMSEDD